MINNLLKTISTISLLLFSSSTLYAGAPQTSPRPEPRPWTQPGNGDDRNPPKSDYAIVDYNNQTYKVRVTGRRTTAKSQVIGAIKAHPEKYQDLLNNGDWFQVKVVELGIGQNQNGERLFIHPETKEGASVAARPMMDYYGDNVVGVEITLPKSGVHFRAHDGTILDDDSRAMPAHELKHANDMAVGRYNMGKIDASEQDRIDAENAAQEVENFFTGEDLDYYTTKNGGNQTFYDSEGPIESSQEWIGMDTDASSSVARFYTAPSLPLESQVVCKITHVRCYNSRWAYVTDSCGNKTRAKSSKCQN